MHECVQSEFRQMCGSKVYIAEGHTDHKFTKSVLPLMPQRRRQLLRIPGSDLIKIQRFELIQLVVFQRVTESNRIPFLSAPSVVLLHHLKSRMKRMQKILQKKNIVNGKINSNLGILGYIY
mgnify:CR=1 FL=1